MVRAATKPRPENNENTAPEDEPKESHHKLRFTEPDLCIILKYTPDEGGANEVVASASSEESDGDVDSDIDGVAAKLEETDGTKNEVAQKEYHMYSQVLAKQSNFIDTSLSVDMKEKQTQTIVFQDVKPEIFEKALQYLEDIKAAFGATPTDVLQVVGFYHMYDFPEGLIFADMVLSNYFIKLHDDLETDKHIDMDEFVDSLVAAGSFGLGDAFNEGESCFNIFASPYIESVGPIMLTEKHVAKLQPLFLEDKLSLPDLVKEVSKEELESPLFPKYFVKCVSALNPFRLSIEFATFGSMEFERYTAYTRLGRPLPHGHPSRRGAHWRVKDPVVVDEDSTFRLIVERIQRGPEGHSEERLGDEQKDGDWAIMVVPMS